MRRKKYLLVIIALTVIASIVLMRVPVKAPDPYVRVYVDQPLGYIPGVPADSTVTIDILIETSDIGDNTVDGIAGWGMDVEVDPAVLDINLTAGGGFPPVPPKAKAIGAVAGYFLYEYTVMMSLGAPSLLSGASNPLTGYWDEMAEMIMPTPSGGAGDYTSENYPKLVTLQVTSKSETAYSKIDLIDVEYMDADGVWHAVDEIIDGDYNQPTGPVTYDLTISVEGSGSTDPAEGVHPYAEDTVVPVTATAAAGWEFNHWMLDGVDAGSVSPIEVTMDADHALIANFTEIVGPLVPTIKSCDSTGTEKSSFDLGEEVWVKGNDFEMSKSFDIYVVSDVTWSDGMPIPARVLGTETTVSSDSLGNIAPTRVWSDPLTPGKYDIVVDVNGNGEYDEGVDALDDSEVEVTAGFFVIPEFWLGTILGLVACFAAFGVFYASKRKHLSNGLAR
jgi:hypothetical protein